MKKKLLVVLLMALMLMFSLGAEDYYDASSQIFTITIGADLPFTNSYVGSSGNWETGLWWGENGTHFNIGGYGSIDYSVFINNKIALGGEIGYQFNRCTDEKLFTQVPLLFKVTYVPLQGKFELPLSLGVGLNFLSYQDKSMLSPTITLSAGARYFFTDNWAIGLKSGINFTAELYFKSEKNGLHTSIPCQLYASYRH